MHTGLTVECSCDINPLDAFDIDCVALGMVVAGLFVAWVPMTCRDTNVSDPLPDR